MAPFKTREVVLETRFVARSLPMTAGAVEDAMIEAKAYRHNGSRRRAILHAHSDMVVEAKAIATEKRLTLKTHEACLLEGWAVEVIPEVRSADDLDVLLAA